ncbi:cellulose binding domain-containing protein [Dactylosporangium aurantiacum]|uniref:Cellulose binding domain-containing protein n=1 Tax=Dactylosporangium aurantiacum TaxID=35754 RepID=A0A9Q9MF59_9ACTN|nr:cellulose binding domain-containing protein [Dactylosporangium aurantiacum]MDG6105420.1 cellulose binding domain-containing protein [Dactylosporangium aurantiacum]UWZ54039.1 cellulose binding domain-containing protein [Dactylosporangium aurantiacum]
MLVVTAVAATVVAGTMSVLFLTREPATRVVTVERTQLVTPSAAPVRSGAGVVKAGYAVRSKWKDGFNAEVTVTNIGSQPLQGWIVQLQLPAGVDPTSTWGAAAEHKADRLTLRSQSWNTYLEPGGSIRMGFEAKGKAAEPVSCTVNGSPC